MTTGLEALPSPCTVKEGVAAKNVVVIAVIAGGAENEEMESSGQPKKEEGCDRGAVPPAPRLPSPSTELATGGTVLANGSNLDSRNITVNEPHFHGDGGGDKNDSLLPKHRNLKPFKKSP